MADIKEAFKILMKLEFSSPADALEKNPTESGYTFMGIYYTAHPSWEGWQLVRDELDATNGDVRTASVNLYNNPDMHTLVYSFYKDTFWDVARLDELSQIKANEMFIFGVNAGMKNAIKLAQRVVGVLDDGIPGNMTMSALLDFDDEEFDRQFDEMEIKYYEAVIARNPAKRIFAKGWRNRAYFV